jgi:thymidylate kinase
VSGDVIDIDATHALWLSARSRLPATYPAQRRMIVVELVGPAGAGKTSVRRAVEQRVPYRRPRVRVDRLHDLPGGVLSTLPFLPELAARALRGRVDWSWRCAQQLVRLNALRGAVERAAAAAPEPVLLDEGPVFALAKLHVLCDGVPAARMGTDWWAALERWRRVLGLVVWMDAADDVLMRRIRERSKAHRVKRASDGDVASFLARYRVAYGEVLSRLAGHGGPEVLRIDAGAEPVDATATRLLRALGAMNPVDS